LNFFLPWPATFGSFSLPARRGLAALLTSDVDSVNPVLLLGGPRLSFSRGVRKLDSCHGLLCFPLIPPSRGVNHNWWANDSRAQCFSRLLAGLVDDGSQC
jgi:hypothetical protein